MTRSDRLQAFARRLYGGAPKTKKTSKPDRSDWYVASVFWSADLPTDAPKTCGDGRFDDKRRGTRKPGV
jgi:hypothetical protein